MNAQSKGKGGQPKNQGTERGGVSKMNLNCCVDMEKGKG